MNSELNSLPNQPQAAAPSELRASDIRVDLRTDACLPHRDLWERIRSGFGMQEMDSPLVARQERWYANQPEYVERMTDRARLYLYFIVREVERRDMPMEIALLPMIESAFNPSAYSVARASGIWQFIPSTGKHFGMKQNWWYDGRRDVVSATNGALDYLQNLHDEFGSWELALAAYNCGEHCIERAQKKNRKHHKPTDYLSLKLPRETRNYVPKLLAVKRIIADPAGHGLALHPIPNEPYFAAITPTQHIDVTAAAALADMPMEDFQALNPANSRPVILQNENTLILLPADKTDQFMARLKAHEKPLVSWQPYQSKKGEKLDQLAARYNITLDQLRKANGISSHAKECTGQKLLVPATEDESNREFEAFNMHLAPTLDDSHTVQHIVRRGETLGAIARRYHVSVASLKAWNGGRTLIRPGQRLVVAAGGARKSHHRRSRVAKSGRSERKTPTGQQLSHLGTPAGQASL